jgi:DNA-binding CsgD family transcriptional regulator
MTIDKNDVVEFFKQSSVATLSTREREVVELVAQGYTNDEVARRLYISIKTAEHHLNAIYRKLEACFDASGKHRRVLLTQVYNEWGRLNGNDKH